MTVSDLIEKLQAMPQDAIVEIAYEATGTDQFEVRLEQSVVLLEAPPR